jgi:mRNA-degrading endonuclease RelE of RelBE toxin-antitoxin system
VGNWRMIGQVRDDRLIIYIVRVGHRREVYK